MNEVLDHLVGAQYFSCIDLAQGYLQVSLAKEDQPKTAFLVSKWFMGMDSYVLSS